MDNFSPPTRIAIQTERSKLGEQWIALIVSAGGGNYVGLVQGIPGRIETVVLFISPQTRTTLGLPVSLLSAEAVCERISKSNPGQNRCGPALFYFLARANSWLDFARSANSFTPLSQARTITKGTMVRRGGTPKLHRSPDRVRPGF